jgi:DNA repair protein RecO (recombination protein O)
MALRLPGVNKSASKLKAISEPFAKSCARIYIRRNASVGCITGGKLESVYPNIRSDFKKTRAALYFCELFYRLTADAAPNEQKFLFLEDSLNELEHSYLNPAFAPAFLLRFMQLSGFGLKDMPVLDIDENFWDIMHNAPMGELNFITERDKNNLNKAKYVCRRFLNKYLQYPLNTISELELTALVAEQEVSENVFSQEAGVLAV